MMKIAFSYIGLFLLLLTDISAQRSPFILLADSQAQDKNSEASKLLSVKEASELLSETRNKIKMLQLKVASLSGDTDKDETYTLLERVEKYQSIETNYERFIDNISKKNKVEDEVILIKRAIETMDKKPIDQSPPYSLSVYDNLFANLLIIKQKKRSNQTEIALFKKSIDYNALNLEKILKEFRSSKEKLEEKNGGDLPLADKIILIDQKLDIDLLKTEMMNKQSELDLLNNEIILFDLQIVRLEYQINFVKKFLFYDQMDIDKQVDDIKKKKEALEKHYDTLLKKQKSIDRSYIVAREALLAANKEASVQKEMVFKVRSAEKQTHNAVLKYTEKMLSLLKRQEIIWLNRYRLIKETLSQEILLEWEKSISYQLQMDKQLIYLEQKNQISLQQELIVIETRLAKNNLTEVSKKYLKNWIDTLNSLAEKRNEYTNMLFSTQMLDEKLYDEISHHLDKKFFINQVTSVLGILKTFWHYEIWVIDDRPLTVRKIIFALFIFFTSLIVAKYLLNSFKRYLIAKAQFKETTISSVHKMVSYFTYLLILLLTLRMVNIPLAAFAFLGGAIAIGLGFGAQNLINNFISGFIIMGEKPISIGDLIEMDGILGKVEEIGARCTQIRTGDNIHILVPNSSFLEKNITNWTLADRKIRAKVRVGVVYGSDVEKVKTLLLESVLTTENILRFPDPYILFQDFGDNALIFDIFFWISIRQIVERHVIESNVRFRLNELFGRAGIIIAFPQRDTHLYTSKPLEVKWVNKHEMSDPYIKPDNDMK